MAQVQHQSDVDAAFWRTYKEATQKLQKKYIFKNPPYAEVRAQYKELLNQARRRQSCPEFEALCQLAIARCDEAQATSISTNPSENSLLPQAPINPASGPPGASGPAVPSTNHNLNPAVSSSSLSQSFSQFLSLDHHPEALNGTQGSSSASSSSNTPAGPPIETGEAIGRRIASGRKLLRTHDLNSRLPLLLLPLHMPLPVTPLALQSFLYAAKALKDRHDLSPAGSVIAELAAFLRDQSSLSDASDLYSQAADLHFSASSLLSCISCLESAIYCSVEARSFPQAIQQTIQLINVTQKLEGENRSRVALGGSASILSGSSGSVVGNHSVTKAVLELRAEHDERQAKIILLLLHCVQREFNKTHEILLDLSLPKLDHGTHELIDRDGRRSSSLEKARSSKEKRSFERPGNQNPFNHKHEFPVTCDPSDLIANFYDLVIASEEQDSQTLLDLAPEILPYLTDLQRLLFLSIIDHTGFPS